MLRPWYRTSTSKNNKMRQPTCPSVPITDHHISRLMSFADGTISWSRISPRRRSSTTRCCSMPARNLRCMAALASCPWYTYCAPPRNPSCSHRAGARSGHGPPAFLSTGSLVFYNNEVSQVHGGREMRDVRESSCKGRLRCRYRRRSRLICWSATRIGAGGSRRRWRGIRRWAYARGQPRQGSPQLTRRG